MRWRELLQEATRRLQAAGIENPRFEARLLAGEAAGLSLEELVRDRDETPTAAQRQAADAAIARRERREPASHILGWREFWGLRFLVDSNVLTPRPDSETLIEAVLQAVADRNARLRLVDLGTGSGCLAIALLHELPRAQAVASDISPQALALARRNAQALGVEARITFHEGVWARGLAPPFDIAVSNPPYIGSGEIETLAPEVARYEPRLALDGGPDGLAAYRVLAADLPTILVPGGLAALEVGSGQAADVEQLLAAQGFSGISRHRDLGGIDRVITARRPLPEAGMAQK